jgi:hypothetical protein
MRRKPSKEQCIGEITTGISPNTLALRTIAFVRHQLSAWRDDPDRRDEKSEDKLNLQLCKFLDSQARNSFQMVRFDHEEYQADQRRVDLSASPAKRLYLEAKPHTIYDPVLVLEGKRLPAPAPDREKEYVTGLKPNRTTGGIQRFKLGLHGARLDLSAMIGYVQERSVGHWYDKINEWILELASGTIADGCVWKASETLELLEEDRVDRVASYRSVHTRTGEVASNTITLHHLWIAMN